MFPPTSSATYSFSQTKDPSDPHARPAAHTHTQREREGEAYLLEITRGDAREVEGRGGGGGGKKEKEQQHCRRAGSCSGGIADFSRHGDFACGKAASGRIDTPHEESGKEEVASVAPCVVVN